jgi:molybdate transport system substrate-binding protein
VTKIVRFLCLSILMIAAQSGCKRSDSGSNSTNPTTQPPRQLNIAAAADLKFALDEIATNYRQLHPNADLQITYGSSGNFYSQLSNKAPFDLFLSADVGYVDKLIAGGSADKDSKFLYGIGQIVLWVPKDSKLDVSKGLQSLLDPSVKKIAIANPQHAPYGRAAEAALKTQRVWNKIQDKLVLGENIAQTAQFVQSGSVDAGIIALSLAMSPSMKDGRYFPIPQSDYPKLEQGGLILSWAQDRPAADAFRQFLTGSEGREVLAKYGFGLPQ